MTNKKYELTDESRNLPGGTTVYRIKALRNFADVKKGQLGGFVESDYNISHTGDAWAYHDAMILGRARVVGNARVYDSAIVKGHARVKECATISGVSIISESAEVRESASVNGGAKVCGRARVLGFASVEEQATIKDDAWVHGSAFVRGDAVIGALTNLGGVTYVCDRAEILCLVGGSHNLLSNAVIRGDAHIVHPNDVIVISSLGKRHDRLTAYFNKHGVIEVTTGCFQGPLNELKKQVQFTHGSNIYGEQYRAAIAFIENFLKISRGMS